MTPTQLPLAGALALALLVAPAARGAEYDLPPRDRVDALIEEAFGRPLAADARLDEAARALAEDILREQVLDEEGRTFTAARDHLWSRGVADPTLATLAIRFDGALTAAAIEGALGLQVTSVKYTHAGLGVAGGAPGCAVILLTRRPVELVEPVTWEPALEQAIRIRATEEYGEPPEVWILTPDARAIAIPVRGEGEDLVGTLPASSAGGVHRLEVLARGELLALALGEAPRGEEDGEMTVEAAEDRLWSLVSMERQRLGLPPLERHPALSEVARAHSEQLRGGLAFGHRSPDLPAERIDRTGLPHSRVLENVARARSLDLAHALIMASPGHRSNLCDPRITHGGVGAAVSEPLAWYVTQELVRLLPPVDRELEVARAREAVDQARQARGKPPLDSKRALDRIAQRWADAVGRRDLTALDQPQIRELTGEVRFHLDDVERVVADLAWIDGVDQLSELPQLDASGLDQYGLGLYQDPGGGMLAVVVVLVDRAIP